MRSSAASSAGASPVHEGAEVGWLTGAANSADGHTLDEGDRFALLQAIPNGSSAAIALIEHVWAKPLRAAIGRANGREISNSWLRAEDLIRVGMVDAVPPGSMPD